MQFATANGHELYDIHKLPHEDVAKLAAVWDRFDEVEKVEALKHFAPHMGKTDSDVRGEVADLLSRH